jgi:hypothetical protein
VSNILELPPQKMTQVLNKVQVCENELKEIAGFKVKLNICAMSEVELAGVDNLNLTKATIIKKVVLNYLGATESQLTDKNRKTENVEVRGFYMFALKTYTTLSLKKIGLLTGGKDHSTVINSNNTFNDLYETDRLHRRKWEELKMILEKELASVKVDKPLTFADIDKILNHKVELITLRNRLHDETDPAMREGLLRSIREKDEEFSATYPTL